ncbi:Ninjurin-2 [Manis pentadactyla]|nr:Ninjurin-2 [Manis pentadactyla]
MSPSRTGTSGQQLGSWGDKDCWREIQPGSPSRSQPVNLNHYATKKSVPEGMLGMALFLSNTKQLRAVLEQEPSSQYYSTLVATGILLVLIARLNLNGAEKQWRLNQLSNAAGTLVFITLAISTFITAFGGPRLRLCLPLSSLLCWADGHFPVTRRAPKRAV